MAINIKELFVTDLDPNSGAWWSKDKVDKINYNFVQLSNGGTPGPQGTIGADGGFGPIGAQGDTGYKGPKGFQGYQGVGSLNDWDYFPEQSGLPGYLFPRKNPITDAQSAPVALRIGFLSTDPEYVLPADPINAIQIVKVTDNKWNSLRVEDNNESNGYNFSIRPYAGDPRFEISPDVTSSLFRIIYTAQTIILKTGSVNNSQLNDSIIITDSQITVNTDFNLGDGGTTKSENAFRFTTGAGTNKVLVSTDSNGNVEWKDVKEVFGTFPVGSIISIRANEFNTTNFWLNDSISVTSGSPLNNIYGRGKVGTDYEGWYLCNGETWESTEGFNQVLTPNLNNFSYTIGANGDAQNLITVPDAEPILIGGYDLNLTAIPDLNGVYTIGYTNNFPDNDTSPGSSFISMGNSGAYYSSKMIHIVYLEKNNLKWSHTGIYVPPVTTTTITLTSPQTVLTVCSAPVTSSYSWNGPNEATWNTFTIPSTYKLFNIGTTNYAPTGWYANSGGYPIYWNSEIGQFTLRGATCVTTPPPNYTYNFRYSEVVNGANLNGSLSSISVGELYLDYNTPLFINATTLKWSDDQLTYPPGTNAPAGWYRETTTGVRRYWNGNIFLGVSFTEDWVSRVYYNFGYTENISDPGYNNAIHIVNPSNPNSSLCDLPQDYHLTYVAGSNVLTVPLISPTQNIKNYGSALYVTLDWEQALIDIDGEVIATPPLVNIKDQSKPNSTQYYNKVYIDTDNWSSLTLATGKLNLVSSC